MEIRFRFQGVSQYFLVETSGAGAFYWQTIRSGSESRGSSHWNHKPRLLGAIGRPQMPRRRRRSFHVLPLAFIVKTHLLVLGSPTTGCKIQKESRWLLTIRVHWDPLGPTGFQSRISATKANRPERLCPPGRCDRLSPPPELAPPFPSLLFWGSFLFSTHQAKTYFSAGVPFVQPSFLRCPQGE